MRDSEPDTARTFSVRALEHADCDVRFDALTRQLYATDASIYQVEPCAVAFPRSSAEAGSAIRAAMDAGIPVTPRGAGTGLAGGAIGDGLIVDMARHTRQIADLDVEGRTVRVGAGVVLDQLNEYLLPHGLCFGPDVATSSRATLGGMIANNSSGARAPVYGVTIDHVVSVEAVLADGSVESIGADSCTVAKALVDRVDEAIARNADVIGERFPYVLVKRWPGYGIDRYLRSGRDLVKVIAGSEGTLVGVASAELRLSLLPERKALGVIFFASVDEAMQAAVHLLDLKPAAIEHVDRMLFEQTRGQLAFQAARDLLGLDAHPCEAFLIVEFYDDIEDPLEELARRNLGLRTLTLTDAEEMVLAWDLRKAGLNLLTGRKGAAKPIAGVEDVAVRPEKVADYVAELEAAVEPLGLDTSYYGHVASGLVHVRPLVDLHRADSIAKYRKLAEAVSDLTKRFGGSFAGEHGVGMARVEFMADQIGPELLDTMREIKRAFDPKGLMNPGKVLPGREYRIDTHLRSGDGHAIPVPFEPMDAEPTVTVAVKRVAPSITFEGHGLTLGGASVTGAIEVRWTTEGMNLVDGRPVHDGTILEADGPVYVSGGGGAFPGRLRLYHEGSRILVVNELPLERYIEGVVGSELPASWGTEVKKAQAVAARSYALVQRARREGYYALESSTLDQVFKAGAVDSRTTGAVEATRGQILVQDDSLVEAFYHATCAGHTEAAAYVWPERGVPFDWSTTCDHCQGSPLYSWERSLSIAELSEALRRERSGMGIVTALKVLGRTPSGRARSIRLSTENGSEVLGGNDFRRIVGYTKVRSTRFEVEEVDEGLLLRGHGAGHGVGMCQWGAHGMVDADHTFQQVLEHYYEGAKLTSLFE